MPDENALRIAAEAYVSDRLALYSFPESQNQYRLLMEIAFMEGAQWQSQRAIAKLDQRLSELRTEVANA